MGRIDTFAVALAFLAAACSCSGKKELDYSRWYTPTDPAEQPDTPDTPAKEVTVKLMSFNLRIASNDTGTEHAWENRRSGVYEMLRTERPVIVGSQECQSNQWSDIVQNCPEYGVIGVGRNDGKNSGEGVHIFYLKDSVRLVDWGTWWLTDTPSVPSQLEEAGHYRTATWALFELKESGKRLFHINTHLDTQAAARPKEMAVILDMFSRLNTAKVPQVLTGDMNTAQNDPVFTDLLKTFKNARTSVVDTDTGRTFNGFSDTKSSVIDHIFYTGFTARDFKVVRSSFAGITYISDHYPVYSHLTFPENP